MEVICMKYIFGTEYSPDKAAHTFVMDDGSVRFLLHALDHFKYRLFQGVV